MAAELSPQARQLTRYGSADDFFHREAAVDRGGFVADGVGAFGFRRHLSSWYRPAFGGLIQISNQTMLNALNQLAK